MITKPNIPRPKVLKTPSERLEDFEEWAHQFKQAAMRYDNGDPIAAKDLSVQLRKILHTNPNNKDNPLSNLGLDRTAIRFASTPRNKSPFTLVNSVGNGSTEANAIQALVDWEPVFSFHGPWRFEAFKNWWEDKVPAHFKPLFSRKDIVLNVADSDGGAHVDAHLSADYAVLRRQEDVKITMTMGDISAAPERGRQYAAIRQIAYEVQVSLDRFFQPPVPYELTWPFEYPIHPRFYPPPYRSGNLSALRVRLDPQYLIGILLRGGSEAEKNDLISNLTRSQLFWQDGLPRAAAIGIHRT